MSVPARTRQISFFAGGLVVALILAGLVSYFASSSPDGLDSVAQHGCEVTGVEGGEQLDGECIARHAADHPFKDSLFADYAVDGDTRLTGVAGIVGVLATLGVAGGLFWLLARRRPAGRGDSDRESAGGGDSAGSG